MDPHGHPKPKRAFTGLTCELHPAESTLHAVKIALERAAQALQEGRLLSPMEAMALAGPEARKDETLFSIARAVAWETGTDQAEILCRLGERYPDLA
jgi:hypothetical protein